MENSALLFCLWNIYMHAHAHTGVYSSQMQWEMGTVYSPNLIDQKIKIKVWINHLNINNAGVQIRIHFSRHDNCDYCKTFRYCSNSYWKTTWGLSKIYIAIKRKWMRRQVCIWVSKIWEQGLPAALALCLELGWGLKLIRIHFLFPSSRLWIRSPVCSTFYIQWL